MAYPRPLALVFVAACSAPADTGPVAPPPAGLTVVDLAPEVGVQGALPDTVYHGRACLAADFDGDERTDLWVGNPGDDSYVMLADASYQFSPGYFLEGGVIAWAGAAADYDDDGDTDVFVAAGGNEQPDFSFLLENTTIDGGVPGAFGFRDATASAGVAGTIDPETGELWPIRAAGGAWGDVDLDGDLDLFVSVNKLDSPEGGPEEGRNLLYRNDGGGVFTEIGKQAGLDAGARRPTRHSALFDADNDGDLDLYENNYKEPNVFWRNRMADDGVMRFEDATTEWGLPGERLDYPSDSYAAAGVDFNNDGWTDLIVFAKGDDPGRDTPYPPGHALFLNTGGLGRVGFVNVAQAAGINDELDTEYGVMGCQAADLDADGVPDVYVGNGAPVSSSPDFFFLSEGTAELTIDGLGTLSYPTYVSGTYLIDFPADMPPALVYAHPYPYHTHGQCAADFDGDGYYELFVTNGGPAFSEHAEPDRLFDFVFGVTPPAIRVRLEGDGVRVNRDAIGAAITVRWTDGGGAARATRGLVQAGTSFSAQNDRVLTLGMPGVQRVDALEVVWPDGTTQQVDGPYPTTPTEVVVITR